MKLTFLRAFDQFVPADDQTIEWFINLDTKEYVTFEVPDNAITQKQVNALNLWCRMVAECFREAGLDVRQIIREDVEIPVTEYFVKNNLYKPLLEVRTGKKSTMDQTTTEPSEIAEIIHRHYAQKYGLNLPEWPSRTGHGD